MADEKNIGGILLAFLAGTVVGGALALLFAPSSGAETRQKIKTTSLDAKDVALDKVETVRSEAAQLVERGKERAAGVKSQVQAAVEAGKERAAGVKSQVQAAVDAGKEAYTEKKSELTPKSVEEE